MTGMCMSTTGPNNGTPITLEKCSGKRIQTWHEMPTKNGWFLLENDDMGGKCVDLPGSNGVIGFKTQVWDCKPTINDNMQYEWKK